MRRLRSHVRTRDWWPRQAARPLTEHQRVDANLAMSWICSPGRDAHGHRAPAGKLARQVFSLGAMEQEPGKNIRDRARNTSPAVPFCGPKALSRPTLSAFPLALLVDGALDFLGQRRRLRTPARQDHRFGGGRSNAARTMVHHCFLRGGFIGARGNASTIGKHEPLTKANFHNDVFGHFRRPSSKLT